MKRLAPYRPSMWVLGIYVLLLLIETGYQRFVPHSGGAVLHSYWEHALTYLHYGYVVAYVVFPLAAWCVLSQLRRARSTEQMIRYPTRTRWALAQGINSLGWSLPLVALLAVATLGVGIGLPFQWEWPDAAYSDEIRGTAPWLAAHFPSPFLEMLWTLIAIVLVLGGLTILVALATAWTESEAWVALAVLLVLAWTFATFGTESAVISILSPLAYALPCALAGIFPLGIFSGPVIFVATIALISVCVTMLEERFQEQSRKPRRELSPLLMSGIGGVALLAISAFLQPQTSPGETIGELLAGSGYELFSVLPYGIGALLVVVPALVVAKNLTESLETRRYQEMIRVGKPAYWLLGELRRTVPAILMYSISLGATAAILTWLKSGGITAFVLGLAALWCAVLAIQIEVLVVGIVATVVAMRRSAGGGYALLGYLLLAVPLGQASYFMPAGQSSALRIMDEDSQVLSMSALPLVAVLVWLLAVAGITCFIINRTRGELE